jgi:uncharacterized protein (DUF433 family)
MDWPALKANQYLEIDGPGEIRLRGTRLDLCVIVEDYLDGHSAEQMVLNYPTTDLETVYGTIAYYLGHREDVDHYVKLCRERANTYHTQLASGLADPVLARLRALKAGNKAA